jgi:salicylate hydroxylase
MFPTTGQGACQCLEDGAALGILLSSLKNKDDLPARLQIFEDMRRKRVLPVHALSGILLGQQSEKSKNIARAVIGKEFSTPEECLIYTNG